VVYRGEEAVDKFLECLEEEQKHSRETWFHRANAN
jgi:hypothetical protein